MFKSRLSFSLGLGTLSGLTWIISAFFANKVWTILIAMGLMAIIGTVLISKRKTVEFRSRFAMAFGAAWVALIMFASLLIYMRGATVPIWLHLINVPITLAIAGIVGVVIATISRPWHSPTTT